MKNKIENLTVADLLAFFKSTGLHDAYPNVSVSYRILGTLSVSSASAERSFSKLKLIKNYLRSTIKKKRLSGLA